MKLTYTGEAKDVVQFPGGGKLSTAPADPGDPSAGLPLTRRNAETQD